MFDITLESARALVLLGILIYLWRTGRNRFDPAHKGWNCILGGFALLFLGSVFDITDNFDELSRFIIIGDTEAQAFVEKVVGFLGGFVLLAIGLVLWLPSVQRLSEEIAERKQAERTLVKTQADLRSALSNERDLNQMQRELVSMTSHEFRTPLTIIDGSVQRLKRKLDTNSLTPEDTGKRIEKIARAVLRMKRLMDSMLAAAAMNEGKIKVEIGRCDIGTVVREVCSRHQEIAAQHCITHELVELPKLIAADAHSLELVVSNLLSNAVKYAPHAPKIEVTGYREGQHVVIAVRDYGIGIDEEDLDRIGERFFRAKTSAGIEGTGIGLSLVKFLVGEHGGTLDVQSAKDDGSIFTVRLPIAGPKQAERPETKAA